MKVGRYLCAAVVAGCVFASATAAQAGHFVFDVTVTEVGNTLLATPIQFQEVYNLPYSGTAPQTFIVDPITQNGFVDAAGAGSGAFGTVSPFEQGVLDQVSPPTSANGLVQAEAFATINGGVVAPFTAQVGFGKYASNLDLLSGTLHRNDLFSITIVGAFNGPGSSIPTLTPSGFFDVLNGFGTFDYLMELRQGTADYGTGDHVVTSRTSYTGTATFNSALSAIPEPQTWVMMLVGFGGLGGALRASRRRRATAVA